jgi:dihydrofolate synthase/folylpolyglutamate synthase
MAERSLGQWLSYLEGVHPRPIDLGLARVAAVGKTLGLLPVQVPVITVAGTNGKGSVVYCLDALLSAHGLRCGRYTSPHLLHYNERIAIDGASETDAAILAAFKAIEAARGDTTLTYFEFATLAALYCFRERAVDLVLLEVGLGGRLDATNIVDADVAVITAIDLDHQGWLGDTREAIGIEKAGIARRGQPVVLAEHDTPASVLETLAARGALPLLAPRDWQWTAQEPATVSLTLTEAPAPRQAREPSPAALPAAAPADTLTAPVPAGLRPANVAAAVQAAACILGPRLDPRLLQRALGTLRVPARRQVIAWEGCELVLDVAHNPAAAAALATWLREHPVPGCTYAVLGLMADKDLPAIAEQLAAVVDGAYALAIPGIDRAQTPERIWQVLDSLGLAAAQSEFTIEALWPRLAAGVGAGDRIVVCGSFHTVAGIMAHLDLGVAWRACG